MRKNPHAVALGRKGGKANTEAQQRARAMNGRKGGQRRKYRIVDGQLEKRHGEKWWIVLSYDRAAREAFRRLKIG